ncbi:MAG: NUDIX domain-containing protein [Chitinivibrionales bacterium]|nr:NUDIX domain-containing protein [Chitinivibrionales bacterium]
MLQYTNFRYCPVCGSNHITDYNDKCLRCSECMLEYYHNTAAAVGVIVEYDKRILLTIRNYAPFAGLLDVPGGFVDYGETLEDGVRRELLEELNLSLSTLAYFQSAPNTYTYRGITYCTTDVFFIGTIDSMESMVANDEIRSTLLIEPLALELSQVAFSSTRQVLSAYRKLQTNSTLKTASNGGTK